MEILNFSPINSKLKPFFNDFVITYLDDFYINTIKEIEPKNEIQERALVLFIKTINSLKSINTLFNTGDVVSARILMRSLFELVVLIKKLKNDANEFIRYSKAYEKFKTIEMNKYNLENVDKPDFMHFFSKEELENNIEKLKNEITALGFTPTWNANTGKPKVEKYFEIKQMAIDVDMEYLYKTTYKNLCLDTHTSSGHFNKYYFLNDSGEKIVNLHPYLYELDLMIFSLIGLLFDFFPDFNKLLNIKEKTITEIQYNKLCHISYGLIPLITLQGQFKKEGIGLML
ncbi:DUF5677 domain-containing protein [Niallia sp. 01092]|uniref:DUF5677 domain-containing protein n=1 Tax=unclassified Niallia TaxID=2837522 RepID=UPI003FCF332C